DALDAARQDTLRCAVLVDVDADAPDAGSVSGLQRAEPAATRNLEEHLRARPDLVLRDGLTLVGRDEVVRVLHEHLHARNDLVDAELVARDPDVDRRN